MNCAGEVPAIMMLECASQYLMMYCLMNKKRELSLSAKPARLILLETEGGFTYSSRIQLPTETPPQLMPFTKLPVLLSRRGLSFIAMGLAPEPP